MREETPGTSHDAVPTIVLASASPRRREFLARLGLAHVARAAEIDETPFPDEAPTALAARLAREKALLVAGAYEDEVPIVVIGADTVVAQGNELLGKPVDAADATAMLRQLRGTLHQVHSAICVVERASNRLHETVNSTTVWMRDYDDDEIADYVASGDPMDKAGAYAIQHPEFAPVRKLAGCLSGVIGLPLGDLRDLLDRAGVRLQPVVDVCEEQVGFRCCRRKIDLMNEEPA